MNLGFFKEWRKELREDRKNTPVETFALLLLLGFLGLCVTAACLLILYYWTLPTLIIVATLSVLWRIYNKVL